MTADLSRRALLGSTVGAFSMSSLPGALSASGPMPEPTRPSHNSFRLGSFMVSVISDGELNLGRAADWFKGLPEGEVDQIMKSRYLDADNLSLSENTVVVNTGDRIVLFDTGTGGDPRLGDRAGRQQANLAAAGIDPASVDDVVISHGHPDHMFGLATAEGVAIFPNATVHFPEADLSFLHDDTNLSDGRIGAFIPESRRQIATIGDRLAPFNDGAELVPGIVAMAAPGHMPGHSVFMISSDGKQLLNGADLAHHHLVFTRRPDAYFASDIDPQQMATTRRRFFDMIATDKLDFVGYHFPWPGLGRLVRVEGGYDYVPRTIDTADT